MMHKSCSHHFLLLLLRDKISETFLKAIKKNKATNSLSQIRKQKKSYNFIFGEKKYSAGFQTKEKKLNLYPKNQRLDW